MNRFPSIGRGALLATLLAASSPALAQALLHPVLAQAIVQQPTPNADRLSAQMRILATNPNDLAALVEAGRLSTRLGDPQAAVQFFARAEKIAPSDPRVLAGRASALLTMERPGEALRLFTAAERAGLQPSYFAADRGLAYDLLGYPTNAQRDYRLALAIERDDEVVRRLALSLGISGDARAANQLLDPLLRQSDRAAWRVHACVLAMQGDAAGADRIAATMLPGFGTQLAPFFRRLASLSPADRAFAVHFGRLGSTPARVADARLAPPVTPVPRLEAPVAVAAAATQPAPAVRTRKLSRRERREAAAAARRETETRQREAELAAARKAEADRLAQVEAARAAAAARVAEAARLAEAARVAEAARTAQTLAAAEAARRAEAERLAQVRRAAEAARLAETQRLAEAARLADAQRAAAVAAAQEAREAAEAEPTQVAVAPTPPAPARSNAAAAATDTTLATIIRNLTIPAAELGVAPLPSAQPAPVPAVVGPADPTPAPEPVKPAPVKLTLPPVKPAPKPDPAKPEQKAAAKTQAKDASAAKGKTADKDAPGGKQKAADKKTSAKGKATESEAAAKDDTKGGKGKGKAAKAAKPDPARSWVQVAGGANKADLPKAYRSLAAKAPALKGRPASVAPARATNRLLVGPFKSDDEAQAFVNTLAKQGLSAFSWTSEAGQKIEQLPK
jgi:hypothetical protein